MIKIKDRPHLNRFWASKKQVAQRFISRVTAWAKFRDVHPSFVQNFEGWDETIEKAPSKDSHFWLHINFLDFCPNSIRTV